MKRNLKYWRGSVNFNGRSTGHSFGEGGFGGRTCLDQAENISYVALQDLTFLYSELRRQRSNEFAPPYACLMIQYYVKSPG